MYFKKIVLLLAVVCSFYPAQAMQPLMELPVLVNKINRDIENRRGFKEFLEILEKEPRYLTSVNDQRKSLIDYISDIFLSIRPREKDSSKIEEILAKKLRMYEDLLRSVIRAGRGNKSFEALLDEKLQVMLKNERKFEPILSCVAREYPELFAKYRSAARAEKSEAAFVYTTPESGLIQNAFLYQSVIDSIKAKQEPSAINQVHRFYNFEAPDKNQSLICAIAQAWKSLGHKDFYLDAFAATMQAGKDDPLFLSQLKKLMKLFSEDRVGYAKLIRIVDEIIVPLDMSDDDDYDSDEDRDDKVDSKQSLLLLFEKHKFPFKRPELGADTLNKRKSAIYSARLFLKLDEGEFNTVHKLIRDYPSLANARNHLGLSIAHEVIRLHALYSDPSHIILPDEKRNLEATFGHLVAAGASLDVTFECFKKTRRFDFLDTKVFEDFKSSGTYPTIRDILCDDYKNYELPSWEEDHKTTRITGLTKSKLKKLLDLDKKSFLKEYHWMRPFVTEAAEAKVPESKVKAEQKVLPAANEQPNEETKKKSTFLDSWKGTLKFFAIGAVVAPILYYSWKRYTSTHEQWYGKPKNVKAIA